MPNLKPGQVIDLLRKCSIAHVCSGCPLEGMRKCDEELMKIAAENIEELKNDFNQLLIHGVPRWRNPEKELPDEELRMAKLGYGLDTVEVIVVVEGANLSTVLEYNGEAFVDQYGDPYRVFKWMPMPDI